MIAGLALGSLGGIIATNTRSRATDCEPEAREGAARAGSTAHR
jgi:hypothetical protein